MSRNTPPLRFDITREGDWIAQAEHDLNVARVCTSKRFYDWASVCAQQAAEKRLKALFHRLMIARDRYAREHNLQYLSRFIPHYLIDDPDNLESHCVNLSGIYIEKRYPDSLPDGYPADKTSLETAKEAIKSAEYIISECDRITEVICDHQ